MTQFKEQQIQRMFAQSQQQIAKAIEEIGSLRAELGMARMVIDVAWEDMAILMQQVACPNDPDSIHSVIDYQDANAVKTMWINKARARFSEQVDDMVNAVKDPQDFLTCDQCDKPVLVSIKEAETDKILRYCREHDPI